MTEDRFDERIRSVARDYNRPGEVPRERMWERVQAARDAGRDAGRTRPRQLLTRATWLWMTLGAAAVLTMGIGIGRWMERTSPDRAPRVATTRGTERATEPSTVASIDTVPSTRGANSSAPRESSGGAERVAVASTSRAGRPSESGATPRRERAADPATMAWRVAALEHLAGTEAMLTSFRESVRTDSGRVDPQLAAWSRDLLTTTRMLQASARSDDPTMKRLLDDLELVLTQIAQYTAGDRHRQEDATLIEQAIERHGVITRLRTIPTGLTSSGT